MNNKPPPQLPDLVILNIFRHLDLIDLCQVGRVCKKWYELSKHPSFWKCVKIDIPKYSYVERFFPQLPPYVKHIYFHHLFPSIFSVPEILTGLAAQCPFLEQLTIKNAGMLHPLEERLVHPRQQAKVQRLSRLKMLSIRYSILISFYSEVLALLPYDLPILDLSSCYFPQLSDFCARLRFLQELYMPQNNNDNFLLHDLYFLRYLKHLKVLDLEGQHIQIDELIESLKDRIYLEKLYLKNCRGVHDTSFTNLIEHNLCACLTDLCIRKTLVTSNGIRVLLTSCYAIRNLGVDPEQFNEWHEMWKCKKLFFLDTSSAIICDHFMKNHSHNCKNHNMSEASF